MVKRSSEGFSWYGSDNLRAQIDLPSCQQYKPGDCLAIGTLNWDDIIDEHDDDQNRADPGAPSGGRSCHGNGNENDDGEGEEDMQGVAKGPRKGKGTKDGKGRGKRKENGNGKRKGMVK